MRHGVHIVTQKITKAVAQIKHRILQYEKTDDFIIATGKTHAIREFVEIAFAAVEIVIAWKGPRGIVDEIGVDSTDEGRVHSNPSLDPKSLGITLCNIFDAVLINQFIIINSSNGERLVKDNKDRLLDQFTSDWVSDELFDGFFHVHVTCTFFLQQSFHLVS